MVHGGISVYTGQLSRLGLPQKTLRDGSQVLVRIISEKGGGKYEGSVAGARVTLSSQTKLKAGSSFPATITTKNGQILLSPVSSNLTSNMASDVNLSVLQDSQLMSFLQNLGLPADNLSFHLLQQMKQLEMKFEPELLNKFHNLALRLNGKEKRAVELMIILAKKGLNFSEQELLALIEELGWADDSSQQDRQKNHKKKEYQQINKFNSIKKSWQFLPYELIQNQIAIAHGNIGLLFNDNDSLQLLKLECKWNSSGHRYLFALQYKSGLCKNILMNCDASPEQNEKIAHKLDSVFSSLGKQITIELVPTDLIEGTACEIQDFYSIGGLV